LIIQVEKILSELLPEDQSDSRRSPSFDPTLPQFRPDSLPHRTQWYRGGRWTHEPLLLLRSSRRDSLALNSLRDLHSASPGLSQPEVTYYIHLLEGFRDSRNIPLDEAFFPRPASNGVSSGPPHSTTPGDINHASQPVTNSTPSAQEPEASNSDIENVTTLDSSSEHQAFKLDEAQEDIHEDPETTRLRADIKRLRMLKKDTLAELKKDFAEGANREIYNQFYQLSWMRIYKWREMDATEQEAEARGGWGRLSWEEFERLVKGTGSENSADEMRRRVTMDYLGSWIEFCIP